ncbi:MAG: hypothetical protein E7220_00335 [Clostridiales bacterium]|nr:hypothetical protein [Clostridiales bacterium]
MNTDKTGRQIGRCAGAIILILSVIMMVMMFAADITRAADGEDERPEFSIEVVEEIPAEDIEEEAVPLAAAPDSPASEGIRHIGLMGLLLAGSIAYAAYFINYENKLAALRLEAAEAEARAGARRRK